MTNCGDGDGGPPLQGSVCPGTESNTPGVCVGKYMCVCV